METESHGNGNGNGIEPGIGTATGEGKGQGPADPDSRAPFTDCFQFTCMIVIAKSPLQGIWTFSYLPAVIGIIMTER